MKDRIIQAVLQSCIRLYPVFILSSVFNPDYEVKHVERNHHVCRSVQNAVKKGKAHAITFHFINLHSTNTMLQIV